MFAGASRNFGTPFFHYGIGAARFRATEKPVEKLLHRALAAGGKIKQFKKRPVRWLVYMMVHEAHHGGQIALALKQNGMRLPQKISLYALWGTWVWGKP